MIQPAFERQQTVFGITCAFREDDQRIAVCQGVEHRLQRILGSILALTVNQHAFEHTVDDVPAQWAFEPVIGAGNRSGDATQGRRQRGPQQHEIAVAAVVGEVDALHRLRRATEPQAAGAGE
ncbi:hypothetical protein D3C85_1280590 [compost metagenome]